VISKWHLLYSLPLNIEKPTIAKKIIKNNKNVTTFASMAKDLSKELISLLRLGMA
jgi:hypothetical protein